MFYLQGSLQYPPKKSRQEEEEEIRKEEAREKRREATTFGIVPLIEVLNGEYWRKKEAQKAELEKRKQRIKKKKESELMDTLCDDHECVIKIFD